MNKIKLIKNKIFIIIFLIILTLPWVAGGFLRLVSKSAYDEISLVATEKRSLAEIEWGHLLNSGESISEYINDHIPFRAAFIQVYNDANDAIEARYQTVASAIGESLSDSDIDDFYNVTDLVTDIRANMASQYSQDEAAILAAQQSQSNYFAPWIYQDVLIGREGWLFLYGEDEINYYLGNNILSEETMASYADITARLKALCDSMGKELYVLIAPNKSQVYTRYMNSFEIENSYKRLQQLKSYIDSNTSTTLLYPLTELMTYDYYHQDYYKYDTHWNHYGAYVGTCALYSAMGLEYIDPATIGGLESDAEKYELYTLMGRPDSTITHDDLEFTPDYKPEITVNGLNQATECYVNRTTSNGSINKKLVLVGDSFRVNMMPYLSKDFTSCTFAHRDYYKEVTEDVKNADVIVVEAVERYDYKAYEVMERMISTLSQ